MDCGVKSPLASASRAKLSSRCSLISGSGILSPLLLPSHHSFMREGFKLNLVALIRIGTHHSAQVYLQPTCGCGSGLGRQRVLGSRARLTPRGKTGTP